MDLSTNTKVVDWREMHLEVQDFLNQLWGNSFERDGYGSIRFIYGGD